MSVVLINTGTLPGSTQWDRPPGNDGRFDRHATEDGVEFFVGPNGNSTWDIP